MRASANELNFIIGCDIPKVDIDLMKTLLRQGRDFDAVIPRIAGAEYEPLFAVYKRSALKAIEKALLSGNNRIIDALSGCKVWYIELTQMQRIENINTPEDYRRLAGKEKDVGV